MRRAVADREQDHAPVFRLREPPGHGVPAQVCDDGTRPLCIYGYVGNAAFVTSWC